MRIRSEGKAEFGVRVGIRGVMGNEVRMEGKWKLMELELGFMLGPGLGVGLGIGDRDGMGVRG